MKYEIGLRSHRRGHLPCLVQMAFIAFCGAWIYNPCHAQNTKPLATFSIKEHFGVSHPRQIIDFDFTQKIDPKNTYMMGPEGAEVAYQVLGNGNIAVETDLPANTSKSWKPVSYTHLTLPTIYSV